ncbi:hypothetical protein QE152_g30884 [Popillia japonica]|uniref:Peptidase A2 domain-containing protein n=1 Tax=Popillia japonica TaxID=7064 RepID=A0AAW1JD74_POPJA
MLALIDTGSDVNFIRLREYLEALPVTLDNDSIRLSEPGSIRVKIDCESTWKHYQSLSTTIAFAYRSRARYELKH